MLAAEGPISTAPSPARVWLLSEANAGGEERRWAARGATTGTSHRVSAYLTPFFFADGLRVAAAAGAGDGPRAVSRGGRAGGAAGRHRGA
jgi:hypothetical protein